MAGEDGKNYYWQIFGLFQRPEKVGDRGTFLFWDLGTASANAAGKPPPESAPRIRATKAMESLQSRNESNEKTVLVTDGAPCYRALAAERQVTHEACNHSKGVFCVKKRKRNKELLIHTGSIDGMWKLCKGAIPASLATRVHGLVNPKLLKSMRIWQWRWLKADQRDLMEATGKALGQRLQG